MPFKSGRFFSTFFALLFCGALAAHAQSGNAGAVHGSVTDPSGAVIPGATVHLTNSVSGLDRTATTERHDRPIATFANIPSTRTRPA